MFGQAYFAHGTDVSIFTPIISVLLCMPLFSIWDEVTLFCTSYFFLSRGNVSFGALVDFPTKNDFRLFASILCFHWLPHFFLISNFSYAIGVRSSSTLFFLSWVVLSLLSFDCSLLHLAFISTSLCYHDFCLLLIAFPMWIILW